MTIKQYLAAIGRNGGRSRSPAKLAAIRENAKLGGRPAKFRAERRKKAR